MQSPIPLLSNAIIEKKPAALATIVEVKGASPAKVGAQVVLLSDGSTAGTAGGGKLEAAVLRDAQAALDEGKAGLYHYRLSPDGPESVGTLCGGEVNVFIQPYFPPPLLVIVGGGHIGKPLRVMGEAAGFEVQVIDVIAGRATVPELEQVELTDDSYVILITTDALSDEAGMRLALKSPARYIGMIGSLAKCKTIREHLLADGFSESDFERVYAPIGLDLGGTKPNEIAVSILAEVLTARNRKHPGSSIKFRRLPVD